MKSNDFLNEGIGEDAQAMAQDHEVQMARQECYHAAEDAITLHKLLRHVGEQQGLEGWVSAKITLAADYLNTVREHLEYQLMSGAEQQEPINVVTVAEDAITHEDLAPVVEATDMMAKERKKRLADAEKKKQERLAAEKSKKDKKQSVAEGQLNEYLTQEGSPFADILGLNLFMDMGPDGVGFMEHSLVKKYKPIAGQLARLIRAQKKRKLTYDESDMIDNVWYDGSDAYDDMEVEFLADLYNQQIKVVKDILENQQGVAEAGIDRPGMKDGRPYSDPYRRHPGNSSYMTPEYLIQKYKERLAQIAAGPYKRPKEVAQLQSRIAKLEKQGVAEGTVYDLEKEYGYEKPKAQPKRASVPPTRPSLHPEDTDFMDPVERRLRADQARVKAAWAAHNAKKDVAEGAGSVATVVNPTPKNKAKVGTLFGGTYKQKKAAK